MLGACLASIRDVVDQIVVVDTGSADGTVAVARSFGAEVHHWVWTDDFAAARNVGLDQATGRWILYIDADERLAPVSRSDVEALLAPAPEVAFRLLLRPYEGWTPYREYRLWRNDPRIRFEGVIHEKVVPSIHAVGDAEARPIGICDLLLDHVGYEGDQTHKHRRNLPLLRRQLEAEPDNLFNWHHLARVLNGLGEDRQAEDVLREAVAVARAQEFLDANGVLVYSDLVTLHLSRGEPVDELLHEARELYPRNLILIWLQGQALTREDRFDEALVCYEQIASVDVAALPEDDIAYDARLFGDLLHERRALCLFRLGRYEAAAEAYAEALRAAPENHAYRVKRDLAAGRARRAARSSSSA